MCCFTKKAIRAVSKKFSSSSLDSNTTLEGSSFSKQVTGIMVENSSPPAYYPPSVGIVSENEKSEPTTAAFANSASPQRTLV